MLPVRVYLLATVVAGASLSAAADAFSSRMAGAYGATVIHSFGTAPGEIVYPGDGPLALGRDGNFYGATPAGGTSNSGALFQMTPRGIVSTLYSFSAQSPGDGGNADGASPAGDLVEGTDGLWYGVARNGGPNNTGTVFCYRPGSGMTILYRFGVPTAPGHTNLDGMHPNARLLLAGDGSLYGTALSGGRYGGGTLWRLGPQGVFTTLYSFGAVNASGGSPAAYPTSGLIAGTDGNYYGTTSAGDPGTGTPGYGTVYRYSPDGNLTVLHWFGVQTPDGRTPYGPLVQGSDGRLYGTTTASSDSLAEGSAPAIFRITADGRYTLLHLGDDRGPGAPGIVIDGIDLYSGLTLGHDGYLYGSMSSGGEFNRGSIFRISPEGDFVTLYYFGQIHYDSNGNGVSGGVTLGRDGNLYGLTNLGGTENEGTAYRLPLPAPPDWGSGPDITIVASVSPSSISISQGQTATVTWTSTNASVCHVWDGVYGHPLRTVGPDGSIVVAPRKPQAYRFQVNCDGAGKATDQLAGQLLVTH